MKDDQVEELYRMMKTAKKNIMAVEVYHYSEEIPDFFDCFYFLEEHKDD